MSLNANQVSLVNNTAEIVTEAKNLMTKIQSKTAWMRSLGADETPAMLDQMSGDLESHVAQIEAQMAGFYEAQKIN